MAGMRDEQSEPREGNEAAGEKAGWEGLRAEVERLAGREQPLAEVVSRLWREGQRQTQAGARETG